MEKGGTMFCRECGREIEEDSKFCKECGVRVTPEREHRGREFDMNIPLIKARSVFIPWVTMVSVLPLQLFMTVWAGGFFGGFSMIGATAIGLQLPRGFTFIFFGALAFFVVPVFTYFNKKKTYAKTKYVFYSDRLEYDEGFWTTEKKSIKYKDITEANMRRGVIQKRYGLGTIILSTPATGMQRGRARSGIKLSDIENAEEIYRKVLQLIS